MKKDRILRTLAKECKAMKLPPLSKYHKKKHVSWIKNIWKQISDEYRDI